MEDVPAGGPADKAGMKAGDIIVAVNGKPIRNGGELVDRVTSTPIGDPLTVTVLREGKHMDFHVVVADLAQVFPDRFGSGKEEEAGPAEGTQALFGITIENLTDARRDNMGIKQHGVLISAVEPSSFAEDIGMRKGDVIVEINRQPVHSTDDVTRIQKHAQAGRSGGLPHPAPVRPHRLDAAVPGGFATQPPITRENDAVSESHRDIGRCPHLLGRFAGGHHTQEDNHPPEEFGFVRSKTG